MDPTCFSPILTQRRSAKFSKFLAGYTFEVVIVVDVDNVVFHRTRHCSPYFHVVAH
jgi:hypothetical protein